MEQLNLFNEVEMIQEEPEKAEEEAVEVKAHRRVKKQNESDYSGLRTVEIHHDLETEEKKRYGKRLHELKSTIQVILKYRPAEYWTEKHIIHNYALDEEYGETKIVSGKSVDRLMPGSVASTSVVAGIMNEKYVNSVPLYRQEAELKRRKIPVSRQNMSNWLMKCSKEKLQPLQSLMIEDLRQEPIVHMDETTVNVLEEKERSNCYMWVMVSSRWSKFPCAVYRYYPDRKYEHAREMIGADYSGIIQSDGYEAYQKLQDAKNAMCMAHARRDYVEALKGSPLHSKLKHCSKEEAKRLLEGNPGYRIMMDLTQKVDKLSHYEENYKKEGCQPEEILKRRKQDQSGILAEILACLDQYGDQFLPKGKAGQAIFYLTIGKT